MTMSTRFIWMLRPRLAALPRSWRRPGPDDAAKVR
jgi:hypothetical protein